MGVVNFTLSTMSGATKLKFSVDGSTSIGAFIRLVEMTIKAEVRGKGQSEDKLKFHVDSLMGKTGFKGEKWLRAMRNMTARMDSQFEEEASATIMMGGRLEPGDEENEDGASLKDWTSGNKHDDNAEAGTKRAAEDDATTAGKKKAKHGAAAADGITAITDKEQLTFFSLADGVNIPLAIERDDDGAVSVEKLVQRLEAAYVQDRKQNSKKDPFKLWEGERPIEVTCLMFFGLKDRPGGSFVKSMSAPFPARLVPASSPGEDCFAVDLAQGDYAAFRFKRSAEAEGRMAAFPADFVRSMGAVPTLQADKPPSAHAGRQKPSDVSDRSDVKAPKGSLQLLSLAFASTFTVAAAGDVAVLDPSTKLEDPSGAAAAVLPSGQVRLANAESGEWRVGVLQAKYGFLQEKVKVDSLVACHCEYADGKAFAALVKKRGTSGWKKVGSVMVDSTYVGIFDATDFKPGAGQRDDPGAYPRPDAKLLTAIFPEGAYAKSGMGDGEYGVYVKERGGKALAIKVQFMTAADHKQ